MDINNLEEVKEEFERLKELFEHKDKEEAAKMLEELLNQLEEQAQNKIKDKEEVYISLNHVMEYYIYAYYFKPETDVKCTELPYHEYYRTFGDLCMQLEKFHAAEAAYKKSIQWNPVDLDSILALAESYKYMNKLHKYLDTTKEAYRYCCTRATMARYYRNMGYYYLAEYKPEIARACYVYSNIYYKTDNADNELAYLEEALKDKTPEFTIPEMQKIFTENGIEPGPESDTIGVVYRVGELMMEDGEHKLAKDCFSIVYDITQEKGLEDLLNEL